MNTESSVINSCQASGEIRGGGGGVVIFLVLWATSFPKETGGVENNVMSQIY